MIGRHEHVKRAKKTQSDDMILRRHMSTIIIKSCRCFQQGGNASTAAAVVLIILDHMLLRFSIIAGQS